MSCLFLGTMNLHVCIDWTQHPVWHDDIASLYITLWNRMYQRDKSKKAYHPVCRGVFRFVIHPIVDELTDTCSITLFVHLYQLKVKREVSSTVFSTPVVHIQVCRRSVCFSYYQPVKFSININRKILSIVLNLWPQRIQK